MNREIPIFGDEYVDMEFGTGCVKVTPCHDPNDFEMGQRHNLAMLTLQKQRTKQQRQRLAAGPLWNNPFDLVFTNEFGRALNHQTVYKHLKRLLRSCGMGDYTFHSLRHSFATISLENGDDIKTVQTNLGHSTAAFTLKTYAHVSDQMQRSSAARMEELISSLEAVN